MDHGDLINNKVLKLQNQVTGMILLLKVNALNSKSSTREEWKMEMTPYLILQWQNQKLLGKTIFIQSFQIVLDKFLVGVVKRLAEKIKKSP